LSTQYLVLSTKAAIVAVLAMVIASLFLSPRPSRASEPAKIDPAVAAGKDALSSGSRFPWYDRRQDDVRRLNVVPRQSSDDRGTQWTAAPTNAPTTTTPT